MLLSQRKSKYTVERRYPDIVYFLNITKIVIKFKTPD